MRRPVALLLALLVSALLAGCGDGSSAAEPAPPPPPPTITEPSPPPPPPAPSPTFTKADLARIALGPKNAPPGLVFLKGESGPMTLDDVGLTLPRKKRPVTALGFRALHDSVFAARAPASDQRVSQRIWLFRNRGGAEGWLQQTKEDSARLEFTPIEAPPLGEGSWAASGLIQIGGGQAITHAFLLGNALITVSMYGDVTPPTEEGALAAAKAALAKALKS
jgi:hypothetical protein